VSSLNHFYPNVGGMRGEFQRRHGPKFGVLGAPQPKQTIFCVLTEVRFDTGNVKLKHNPKPSLYSVSPQPHGGIIVFSHSDYELINHSVQRSSTPNHFAIGVHITSTHSKVIVAGIQSVQ
jgi:hypothetical protein